MIDIFKTYLRNNSNLTESDIDLVCQNAVARKLHRNEFLLEEGSICRHKNFVLSGLLRTYGLTADGNQHILQFANENSWTLDAESYNLGIPSKYNISAIEASEVLMWVKPDFDQLLQSIPGLKNFSDLLISDNMHIARNRLHSLLSASPEEKYEEFLKNSSHLLSRLPLKMIAAYLGISLKTLNRVRQANLQRV